MFRSGRQSPQLSLHHKHSTTTASKRLCFSHNFFFQTHTTSPANTPNFHPLSFFFAHPICSLCSLFELSQLSQRRRFQFQSLRSTPRSRLLSPSGLRSLLVLFDPSRFQHLRLRHPFPRLTTLLHWLSHSMLPRGLRRSLLLWKSSLLRTRLLL